MFDIILVDDGSGADFAPLFAIAQSDYACHLQRHDDNKGKGRALKTAISYILDNFPNAKGIVTIDSDGQHTYEDMMKCLAEFLIKLVQAEMTLKDMGITASLGAYTDSYQSHKNFVDFFAIADKKMYENKSQKGKSNV